MGRKSALCLVALVICLPAISFPQTYLDEFHLDGSGRYAARLSDHYLTESMQWSKRLQWRCVRCRLNWFPHVHQQLHLGCNLWCRRNPVVSEYDGYKWQLFFGG